MICRVAAAVLLFIAISTFNCAFAEAPTGAVASISSVQIGIKGCFKVGCWTPVRVQAEIKEKLNQPRVDVIVSDSDGVPTTASAEITTTGNPTDSAEVVVFTKVGRINSPIRILLADGNQTLDERTILGKGANQRDGAMIAMPATAELVVALAARPFGITDALPNREAEGNQLARRVIEVNRSEALPTEWYGYDAVDVLLISVGDVKLLQDLRADGKRFAALEEWVQLGGRLVIFCGGEPAREVLSSNGPMAKFAPGTFAELVRLRDTGPLEHFAGTTIPITVDPRDPIRLPRFREINANVEAFAEQRSSGVPVVTRAAYGLGEVAFVGVNFGQSPLNSWSGRSPFLQALLRPYLANVNLGDASQRLVTRGYNDLSGALRQQLGRSFSGVVPFGFGVVAVSAIAYMLFLGPVDYFLVNRWLRRPTAAWITFPLALLVFCGGAAWLSQWRTGGADLRENYLQLVDVDTVSGRARGTYWSSLYCPQSTELNLSFGESGASSGLPIASNPLLSWWGLPGAGIGGMQSGGAEFGGGSKGYRYGFKYQTLLGVPILASGSKSLMARWTAPSSLQVEAELTDQDGLAVGRVTNRTGMTLDDVRLLYGTWAYRLGTLRRGQQVQVSEQLSPRKVRTVVARDAFGDDGPIEGRLFAAEQSGAKEILNLMMFYEAAGGISFAHLPNRHQSFCDMSRLLELGRAMLVANVSAAAPRLQAETSSILSGDPEKKTSIIYRFVLPVNRTSTSSPANDRS